MVELFCMFAGFNTWSQQALLFNWYKLSKERAGTKGEFLDLCLFELHSC